MNKSKTINAQFKIAIKYNTPEASDDRDTRLAIATLLEDAAIYLRLEGQSSGWEINVTLEEG